MSGSPPFDVVGWLGALGLGAYAQAFKDNDVDQSVLASLTADDLRDIGVTSVGHRRRILDAAAKLGTAPPMASATTAAPVAERRHLTVMFCDLADSTAFSVQADPEDYREFIARYRQALEKAIRAHGGYIAHFMGDGVYVYFGYPTASGHDAENAAETALAIVRNVEALEPFSGRQPKVRIGIATGITVVGTASRLREMAGDSAIGETPNLAARLQALATPNAIVVAPATYGLLGALFECQDLGPKELKGFAQPVRAWQVLRRNDRTDRFEALRTGRRKAGFVGREPELAALRRRLAAARAGHGQVAVIAGEAGFGKSRLARHILDEAGAQSAPILQCTSHNVGTPFHPLRYEIERITGLDRGDSPEAAMGKLGALLDRVRLASPERLALLAEFTHVAGADLTPLQGLGSPERRSRTMRLLLELMDAAFGGAAVVLIEDLQWIDPSTAELIGRLLPTLKTRPVLLLGTMRPGPLPDWLSDAEAELVELDRLPHDEVASLVRKIAGTDLPATIVEAIAARSDGVPLFAEELTRGYVEAAAEGRQSEQELSDIPATLAESLLARLDRLKHGRRIASIAAAIAREFPISVLVAVSDLAEADVRAGVTELLEADVLVAGHSAFGEAVAFRHMLVRDAAYQLLLRRERTVLHARIARTLRASFPNIAEALPQIVAIHLADGGDFAGAAAEWNRAGDQASQRSAYAEAIGHYTKAIEANARCPDGRERDEREVAYRLDLVGALVAGRGYAAEGVAEEMERATALSQRLGTTSKLVPVLIVRWFVISSNRDYHKGLEIARQIHDAARSGSTIDRLLSHRAFGTSLLFAGHFARALEELETFLAIYRPERDDTELHKVGPTNHALMTMLGLAEIYTLFDQPETADRWRLKVLEGARAAGSGHNLCNAIMFCGCFLPALRRQHDGLADHAAEIKALCTQHKLPYWHGHADLFAGLAKIHRGRAEEGFIEARRGIEALIAANAFMNGTFLLYAEACLDASRLSEAEVVLDRALPSIEHGETWLSAEYHRLRGRLGLLRGEPAAARLGFETALLIARGQGAKLFVDRAERELAGLAAETAQAAS